MMQRLTGLRTVSFEVTSACNLDCLHCLRDKSGRAQHLPLSLYERLLDEAHALGIKSVILTGGEPSVHPDFIGLARAAVERGLSYSFITNGWNFLSLFERLCTEAGGAPEIVAFSLEGAYEATNDAIRGRGTFRRVMQAISLCRARGQRFSLKFTFQRTNLDEIEQFGLLAASLGASALLYGYHQPTPVSVAHKLAPSLEEQVHARRSVHRLREMLKLSVYLSASMTPAAPLLGCADILPNIINVDYRGRLTLCCQLVGLLGSRDRETDIVADLNDCSLAEGLSQLLDALGQMTTARLEDVLAGRLNPGDSFDCWWCVRKTGMADWLLDHPDEPWCALVKDAEARIPAETEG